MLRKFGIMIRKLGSILRKSGSILHLIYSFPIFMLAFCSFCIYITSMTTTYELNTRELESAFESIKATYPNQVVKIQVREQDTTEYLLSSSANRKHLLESIKNIEEGKNLTSFETLEDLMNAEEEHNKKR